MVPKLLVCSGILFMGYAVYSGRKLLESIRDPTKKETWYVLFLLIILFLIGYVFFLYLLFTSINPTDASTQLVSAILFFGSLFVVIVLSVNYSLVGSLNENAQRLSESNEALTKNIDQLRQKDTSLVEAKEKLERKNEELEKVLEDFYTMRIGMTKDLEAGKLEEENKRIKERLEQLKSST